MSQFTHLYNELHRDSSSCQCLILTLNPTFYNCVPCPKAFSGGQSPLCGQLAGCIHQRTEALQEHLNQWEWELVYALVLVYKYHSFPWVGQLQDTDSMPPPWSPHWINLLLTSVVTCLIANPWLTASFLCLTILLTFWGFLKPAPR